MSLRSTPATRSRQGPRGLRGVRSVAVALLLVFLVPFSGCFGSDDPGTGSDTSVDQPADPDVDVGNGKNATDDLDELRDKEREQGTVERVPSAHFHHYWGNPPIDSATLFDGTVELNNDACQPDQINRQQPPCIAAAEGETHVGSVSFTPEDDFDDVSQPTDNAIMSGKSDTVLLGTKELAVTISWEADSVGELLFFFKPANNPSFLPRQESDYYRVINGIPFTVPIDKRMADPAHQIMVSRWAFMLVANGGPPVADQPWSAPMKVGSGELDVVMEIMNGGEEYIDDPHPDPWGGQDILRYQKTSGDFTISSVSAEGVAHAEYDGGTDIMIPSDDKSFARIVPAGIQTLTAKVWVNTTQQGAEDVEWGFRYHGADTLDYTTVVGTAAGDAMLYEIAIESFEVDPPYEFESYFRFEFFPMVGDNEDVGHIEAEYTILLEAVKDPSFSYYF